LGALGISRIRCMNDDLLTTITTLLREVLNQPDLVITESTTAADVVGWDSFAHINLIMGLEDTLKVRFTTDEIGRMGRVADLLATLRAKA
jgi:acyl carrier protein